MEQQCTRNHQVNCIEWNSSCISLKSDYNSFAKKLAEANKAKLFNNFELKDLENLLF